MKDVKITKELIKKCQTLGLASMMTLSSVATSVAAIDLKKVEASTSMTTPEGTFYGKSENEENVNVTTPINENSSTISNSNSQTTHPSTGVGTFVPYVWGAQGSYNNDDVANKNNYVFPKESLLTGKYLNLSEAELLEKIRENHGQKAMTKAEAYDYSDLYFSYAAKITNYTPGNVYVTENVMADSVLETDSTSYIEVPTWTIDKLMNSEIDYTSHLINATVWEMLRFVKENDKIKYTTLKSQGDMIKQAEAIRLKMPTEKLFYNYWNASTAVNTSAEEHILNFSNLISYMVDGEMIKPDVQTSANKYVDRTFEFIKDNRKNKNDTATEFADISAPGTFNVVAPTLKSQILSRAEFVNEIQNGAKTINEKADLENSLSDYGFYVYNIYSNPAYGMNTELDKKIKEVILQDAESIKTNNYYSNMNSENVERFLKVSRFGGGLNPNMINEKENTPIYDLADLALHYTDVKVLDKAAYTDEEWNKIADTVLEVSASAATELGIKETANVYSEAYIKLLTKKLNEKNIDITRVHEYIFEKDIKAKMKNASYKLSENNENDFGNFVSAIDAINEYENLDLYFDNTMIRPKLAKQYVLK